jgi:hypothetical protein
MGFGRLVAQAAKDPSLLVSSGVGGGLTWALAPVLIGVGGPVGLAVGAGVAATMVGVGAVVGALRGEGQESWEDAEPEPGAVPLRAGTAQAEMVGSLRGYLHDLRELRASPLPDSVLDQAIAALVAAEGAEETATQVAVAVDGLDDALERSRRSPGREPRGGALAAVQRMAERRHALLTKLESSVDRVAEVYTELLELRANVTALDVGAAGADDELAQVSVSLDQLRGSLAELEQERRALP